MSNDKSMPGRDASSSGGAQVPPRPKSETAADPKAKSPAPAVESRLFRGVDWLAMVITTLVVFGGYFYTLAPDLTLEDCGELAVGSFYAGVPHPPGYPVWTIYSWLFTVLFPFSNVAYRVAMSSAVAGAFACGLLALLASRGSSMMIEGVPELKDIERKAENALCIVAGCVAGMLLGFNGFLWSQAVIVEVYTLSVLSLVATLCFLLRWMHAPNQLRYLYWAWFMHGISFTNHQTLIVATMGLQVAMMLAHPRIGRDWFLVNTLVYLVGLFAKAKGTLTSFDNNTPLFIIYNGVGLGSLALCAWLTIRTPKLLSEWKAILFTGGVWLLGASFYFFMPITSATNPPLNWGYPRTWEGFIHAFTRGQYERTNPTNDPIRFFEQLRMYCEGAVDEFNLVYLIIGLVPLVFMFFRHLDAKHKTPLMWITGVYFATGALILFRAVSKSEIPFSVFSAITGILCGYLFLLIAILPFLFIRLMDRTEKWWLGGLSTMYVCLAVLLMVLLNPLTDRQSRELTRVFFTASHVMVTLGIGYGLTLIGALLVQHYQRLRFLALISGAVVSALALYVVTVVFQSEKSTEVYRAALFDLQPSYDPLVRFNALFGLGLAVLFTLAILLARQRAPLKALIALFALMPLDSITSHWSDNEQRGHIFGYWFGHDMFTPDIQGADGKPIYPEMARNAVLFGGTDPGRFNPTYMIFCESFIPASKRRDPAFDRRDVYLITQNALADGTYLNYIRAHYNRSAEIDPPFLEGMFRALLKDGDRETNAIARAVAPIDRMITDFGWKVEKRRRSQGVYPPKEIHTPSAEDNQAAFNEYIADVQRRLQHDMANPNGPRLIKPGEDVKIVDNRVQVQGQVAVMSINGLLTKVIFDKNPDHEFYVEESFPLDWMYPYLEPFGIIMKINRQPLAEIDEEKVRRDHEYWSRYSDRLIGNWITYETPVKQICEFAERVYRRRDFKGFSGDRKFIRDDNAQKAFSKLRSSIGGIYAWRVNSARNSQEQQRMLREADFAFKQALAYCPFSPEAVYRYVNLLVSTGRSDDALAIAETCLKFDEENSAVRKLVGDLRGIRTNAASMNQAQAQIAQLEPQYQASRTNLKLAFELASLYIQAQRVDMALRVLDELLTHPSVDPGTVLSVANAYSQLQQGGRLEAALVRLVGLLPDQPEAWFDLAAIQSVLGKTNEGITSLSKALQLSQARLAIQPKSRNLKEDATKDERFKPLQAMPEFQRLTSAK
jgi:tetratricopeptide (TPR) repeat protein